MCCFTSAVVRSLNTNIFSTWCVDSKAAPMVHDPPCPSFSPPLLSPLLPQRCQRRQYKRTVARPVGSRGWGLVAAEDIRAGDFVMEYLGEVVPAKVAHRRLEQYEKAGE